VHPNELVRARMRRSRSRRHAFLVSLHTTVTRCTHESEDRSRCSLARGSRDQHRRVIDLSFRRSSHPCRAGSTRRFTARSLAVGRTPRAPKGDPSDRSSHFRSRLNYPFDSRGRSRVGAHADTALFLTLLRHDGAQPPP